MKKTIVSFLLTAPLLYLLFAKFASATAYQISTPFADFKKGATPGLAEYIGGLYVYALTIVGVVALGAIIFWGVVYTLSAGMVSKKQDAVDGITQAVYGLLLLLGAYLILYTINPSLVLLREPDASTLKTIEQRTSPTGPEVPPEAGRPSVLIYNVTSPGACADLGGQVFSPCKTYCLATPGLCSASNVCCGKAP